ncbi:hypothetical protein A2368_04795 [Candidatus Collierbacteria bacterium RIFOXYB1_FULL_49_13]|uniref:VIT family protein n=1 Tax=Candidatus Collierbacteria bacterium RIFOXYB1_FULL_49_13 TaxID=1817728 RepID=A0A1F5FFN0_9BACT|nr:MAG: hypothetical protein A2368_04795 [Candidatus Collierbacteria bacterium RIFOXYB1_FULL_49_13]
MPGHAKTHLREIVFGLEDGLVSTLGAISGIAAATHDKTLVLVSALIVVLVESISMAAGTYISDKTEIEQNRQRRLGFLSLFAFLRPHPSQTYFAIEGAMAMGAAYLIGGLISASSYIFLPVNLALISSLFLTSFSLFVIGYSKAVITQVPRIRSGLETMFISLVAAAVGLLIGNLGAYASRRF